MLRTAGSGSPNLGRYMEQITRFPMLTLEEERRLVARLGVDPADPSRQELVCTHLRLVINVARRYRSRRLPLEELIAEGNMGLLWAARHFEPRRGIRFMTYALWWIRKAILEALHRSAGIVRIPEYRMKASRALQERPASRPGRIGSDSTRDDSQGRIRMTLPEMETFLEMRKPPLSLDPGGPPEESGRLLEVLVDADAPDPQRILEQEEAAVRIQTALPGLSPAERFVLERRYGLDGDEPWTLEETGRELGVSRERIRQIECGAKQRLQRILLRPRCGSPRGRGQVRARPGTPRAPIPAPHARCPADRSPHA